MQEERVARTRELASSLWRSAARANGRTLDHWLAAERMVDESLDAVGQARAVDASGMMRKPTASLADAAFPVDQARDLAYLFWTTSDRTRHADLDVWLAAERHVQALCAATRAGRPFLRGSFSAHDYWTQIRERAERIWHDDGQRPGRDLDNWLRAEGEILAEVAAAACRAKAPSNGQCEARAPGLPQTCVGNEGVRPNA